MNMFPQKAKGMSDYSLQSRLFGHRIKPSQTIYEYLIEFLQVAISPKAISEGDNQPLSSVMFPIDDQINQNNITFYPESRMGLKRFIFFPKSKLEGKADIDKKAYEECVKVLSDKITSSSIIEKQNTISIIQSLFNGFSAVIQGRSWFDQNMLPICPEVILPEGMGTKSKRQDRKKFSGPNANMNIEFLFEFNQYTYMARGGEVYYLHVLNAVNQYPQYGEVLEKLLRNMITSFPQFSFLCDFIQSNWYLNLEIEESETKNQVTKSLGAIPCNFAQRNEYTLTELKNLLSSKAHPFEKMDILSVGLIVQLMRMEYLAASDEHNTNCWVIDVNCSGFNNSEMRKAAAIAFKKNEETFQNYLYREYEKIKDEMDNNAIQKNKTPPDETKVIKDAAEDSYKLFRRLGKTIGMIIPVKGPMMRFSLSETVIKFMVLSIIPPKGMITLDEFISCIYDHFGMIIDVEQYKTEMNKGAVKEITNFSFLSENKAAFSQKLKDCGFLRDLSDATSIVENPYEKEEV